MKRQSVFLLARFLVFFACTVAIGQESLIEYPKQLPPPVLKAGWQRISIPQVGSIDIPQNMEVKSEGYKTLTGIANIEKHFTVQQKGLNELRPEAHKLYVRVIIDTDIYEPGECEILYSQWSLTKQEIEEISESTKLEMEHGINTASAQMLKSIENNLKQMTDVELRKAIKGTLEENIPDVELKEMRRKIYEAMKQQMLKSKSLKLIEWFPSTVEEINGMLALSHTYRRQLGSNPIVHCKMYIFHNYDRTHTLIMSYRESEKEIWVKVFPAILSSFRITNIHKPSPISEISDAMRVVTGSSNWILTLIISFILTWGIGLTPPILIRYAILRKPLPKKAAIPIVVFFCIINIVIFTALGSQSKTHAALFFVAWVSYYILHRGYATCGRKSIQTNAEENLTSKDKDSDTVKSASNTEQVDNNNRKML